MNKDNNVKIFFNINFISEQSLGLQNVLYF